jgi:hypothetical protein
LTSQACHSGYSTRISTGLNIIGLKGSAAFGILCYSIKFFVGHRSVNE